VEQNRQQSKRVDNDGKELVAQEHMQEEVPRGKALARKSACLPLAKKQTCLIQ